jgi:hypothetical protein
MPSSTTEPAETERCIRSPSLATRGWKELAAGIIKTLWEIHLLQPIPTDTRRYRRRPRPFTGTGHRPRRIIRSRTSSRCALLGATQRQHSKQSTGGRSRDPGSTREQRPFQSPVPDAAEAHARARALHAPLTVPVLVIRFSTERPSTHKGATTPCVPSLLRSQIFGFHV